MRRESVLAALLLTGLLSATDVMGEIKVDPGQKYLLLATQKTSTMQKELAEAAGMGFRVLAGSPTSGTEMAIFLERVTEQPSVFEYLLLATTRTGTMNKELNREGAKGFRLLPSTLIAKEQMFGGVEIVALLEKEPNSTKTYEYRLLATTLTSTLQKEVGEARQAGFELVGMVSRGEHIVIMEKVAAAN